MRVQVAHKLGMGLKKLGSLANHEQEHRLKPLNSPITPLYFSL
jgi:hypothetical protein